MFRKFLKLLNTSGVPFRPVVLCTVLVCPFRRVFPQPSNSRVVAPVGVQGVGEEEERGGGEGGWKVLEIIVSSLLPPPLCNAPN